MASIGEDIRNTFRDKGKILQQIIVINVAIFIIDNILKFTGFSLKSIFGLPGNFLESILYFWSYITYMFFHVGFFHILFNMLWLFWIGKILVEYLGSRKFLAVYFLGGIAGGLAYVIVYSFMSISGGPGMFPTLVGASAGVTAVLAAVGTLLPDYEIRLFLFGNVKMKYLALGAIILTSVLDFSVNMGGKLAHLGGALFGFFYIRQLQKGVDLSISFFRVIDYVKGIFQSKPKMKAYKGGAKTKAKPKTRSQKQAGSMSSNQRQQKTDEILDKISKSGYDSLSKEEKEFLFLVSKED